MHNNPFKFGSTVTGRNFCNRRDEIAELSQDIRNGTNILLYSPRRYGKTSLLLEVLEHMKAEGYLTYYLDLYPATTKEKFIALYARSIAREERGTKDKILAWLKNVLPKMIPKIILRGEDLDIEFEFDKTQPLAPLYEDLFNLVNQKAQDASKRAVLVLDEFQEIYHYPTDEIEREMRSAIQKHSNVSYIFAGSKRSIMAELFENPDRPFYRSVKKFTIGAISRNELSSFMFERFSATGKNVAADLIDEILDLTECQPYYTQQLGYYFWDLINTGAPINEVTVYQSINRILEVETPAYQNIWDLLTHRQRNLLAGIAIDSPKSLYGQDFINRFSLVSSAVVQKSIIRLVRNDIIHKKNSHFVIEDVFFKKWLQVNFGN